VARIVEGLTAERVRANAHEVRERIDTAAAIAGRDPNDVELLVAVKYVALESIGTLQQAGLTLLGENRAQDLAAKAAAYGGPDGPFTWDFIGQLQSRKVKEIVPWVRLIHSLASDSALDQLARHAHAGNPGLAALIEVNVAHEDAKAGIRPKDLNAFIDRCPIPVRGLMTMPPAVPDPEDNRRHFAALRTLADDHGLNVLSMGTTQDYEVAVEEGATIVRVGSALFQ